MPELLHRDWDATTVDEVGGLVFCRPILVASAIAAAPIGAAPPVSAGPQSQCGDGPDYVAASGDCVHDPEAAPTAPPGATAICRDGDYSFSEHPHSGGTCHGHGGVAQYLP
ncbi:DUF3761 domain-containing protein [Mycobacterium sp. SM1]|uniref:DUF3761 domain-containing protein n=1 Tax=Mycobacterium sp. SM1 TaxID=2816243 RepID=UPI001BCC0BFA|nr:DUF3761 domain-containing protein [Mycobacterium sp. SM1]MBS4728867.1 DUF3761 domain-containing protein [Mycobacterium sp. SM1]